MARWWPFGKKEEKKPAPKRSYDGALYSRLVSDWMASNTSADSEIRGSLKALRSRSRDLGRNNDYVKQFFRIVQNNVVGQGIPFQAQVRMQRGGKLDQAVNDQIEALWGRWAKKANCDVTGKMNFCDIERLLIKAVAENGEAFVRVISQKFGGSPVPMALEVIEADLLDDEKNGRAVTGNEIRMGVEIDVWGRPVAYYFRSRHPGDYAFNQSKVPETRDLIRVPADEVIHLMVMERAHQTRGVPWIASAITRLRHMGGYEEATVIQARVSASTMGFIETPEGELLGDDVMNNDRVTDFEPGVFKKLNPGEKVNVPDMGQPGAQFDPFMRAMLRGVAAGIGSSYESLSRDYSQSNYSSSRLALLDDRDNWRALQNWMIENFHQIVFEKWMDRAVLSGALNLKGFELMPERYTAVRWMPRGWAWVDPQKEVEAYKTAVRSGFMTLTDVVSQSGGDLEELMIVRKRELDIIDGLGISLETDPGSEEKTQSVTEASPVPTEPQS